MTRGPSLLEKAARTLASGPAHTLEVAREVLELRGNPAVASRAVFTLLGGDPRFRVDPEGVWSLLPDTPLPGAPLDRLRYAVVDVETTGGSWGRGDRITEVAVVHVDDGAVGATYHSLVNPERPIPPRIQGFTGITDQMVAVAPTFEGIADRVAEQLDGRVFVAHNERFDWGFVHGELLAAAGDAPEVEHLCTVRLGRLLLPGLRSHGLDALTAHYRIPVPDRHRALGDALATARLLLHLLREAGERGLSELAALHRALAGGIPRRRVPRSSGMPDR